MHSLQPLITNPQSPITVEPTPSALHHPAMAPQSFTTISPFASDPHFDPSLADCAATTRIVIAFVRMPFVRSLARPAGGPFNRFNGVKYRSEHVRVMQV